MKKSDQKERTSSRMATQRYLQLPQAVTMDILSRLSVKTLFNCRCVCKAWLSIISDPQFTSLHASRSPFGILMEIFPPPPLTKPMEIYFTHLEVEACAAPGSDLQLEEITFSPRNTLPPVDDAMREFRLINSCNGLLCFGANEGFPLYVCNPVLGEYITIPPSNRNDKWLIVGLGFSIGTNVYKVFQLNNPDTEAEIYTIGAGGAWRSIGPPPPGDYNNLSFNNFLHGAVHWIPYGGRSTSSKVIQSFDFEREQFRPLSLPSLLAKNQFSGSLTLEVIGGCLHLCVLKNDARKLDMWVMKEYGVQESWTKILAFKNLFGLRRERICDRYNPIMFLSNGEILMFYNFERVVCYNQEEKSFRKIKIPSTKNWSFQPIAYSPSFLSLYDVAKGEDVKRNAKIVSKRYLQLPQAIVMDILSRVSVKTIFNCRCVCKAWLSIISDPQFTHLHASRSPFGILIETFPPPPLTKPMELYFTHLEVEACAASGSDLQLEEITFSPGNSLPPVDAAMPEFRLINSCNGLLCFGANEGFPLYVCNPVLGEYITIPPANRNDKWLIVGLGFSIGTNVYKVFQLNNPDTEAEIYTIGAGGAWRSIGPPPPGDYNNLSFNNFLHGAVHWIPYGGRSTSSKVIQSFDFEREQFRPLSLPSLLAKNQFSGSLTLEVIGGCLHLCVLKNDARKLDMWVMKEYGVQESWTKILAFKNLFGLRRERICDRYNPIMFLSNGEILMFYNFERVVCYNQEEKSFRKIKIPSTKNWSFQPIAYSPSFLSLYDVAKGEDVKRNAKIVSQRYLQLPQAIVMDILSRVSVKTLFNCRCVCKAWLSIISDPQFTHLHASRSPFGILIETFPPPPLTKPMELYFTHLEVEACAAPGSDLQLEEITFSPGNSLPPVDAAMPEFRLINSCNGLLCFGANEGFPLYVCNPVLGEYITIPPANRNDRWLIVGLGFSIGTNVYKVFQLNNPDTEAEIYTIGAGGAWRSIGPPPPGDFNNLSFNNFLHGAVHWIPYGGRSTSSKVIQSFDFEREQFRPLSLPSLLAQNEYLYSLTLEVIGGCLHLCVLEDDASKLDMWVMKEYGVQESWTKILAFKNLFGLWTERICDRYNPIMFLKTGEILMFYNFERVVCYNQEEKSFRKIKIPSTKKWSFQPIAYSPSFLSLYDVAKGEDVKRNAKIVSQRYLQLPQAIVMDILSRLPVKTLFHCRCVCKAWLSIISDPQFTHLHATRSPFGILIETFPPPPLTKPMELYFTHLEVEACAAPGSDLQLEEITFSPGNSLPPVDAAMPEFRLINSCNGLLCFGANEGFPLYVCNPVLGEYITIPPANRNDKWLIVGLGFSIGTNVYKVFQLNNPDTEAEIYTIGAGGAWRSIGPPPPGDYNNLSFNNFLHGAVHWIPYGGRSTSSKVIQSFDFEREQFRPLSLPSLLAQNEFLYSLTLEVIGGCLHLCVLEDDASKLDMWVMKEYGVKESWTKILAFENLFGLWTERICDRYNPIMFLKTGEILMFYNFERVVCYNQEEKSFRKIKIPSTKKWSFQPIAYSPSFLSLYNIAKAEDVKRVGSSKRYNKLPV